MYSGISIPWTFLSVQLVIPVFCLLFLLKPLLRKHLIFRDSPQLNVSDSYFLSELLKNACTADLFVLSLKSPANSKIVEFSIVPSWRSLVKLRKLAESSSPKISLSLTIISSEGINKLFCSSSSFQSIFSSFSTTFFGKVCLIFAWLHFCWFSISDLNQTIFPFSSISLTMKSLYLCLTVHPISI